MDKQSKSMMGKQQNDVALSLTKHLSLTEAAKGSNLIFSPLSIQVVLSVMAAGANGSTLEQLLSFLNSESIEELNAFASESVAFVFADGIPSGGPCLSLVNGVWIDRSLAFKATFKKVVDNIYKATSNQVDFQNKGDEIRKEVNLWAEKETKGLVKDLLPPDSVSELTKLIFASSLYFKASWSKAFDSSFTTKHDFHLTNGGSVKVPFMISYRDRLVSAYDGFKVLRLHYEQGEDCMSRFSMYFFLPDAKDGLLTLVEKMGSEPDFLDRHLPSLAECEFRIPKFKISFGMKVSEVLKEIGLVLPFTEGEADFSNMADSYLYVSSIFHKSSIEVNEEGTEAAAASAAECDLCLSCGSPERYPRIDFVADHPFLFLVRENKTGMVMFIGHVLNPRQD